MGEIKELNKINKKMDIETFNKINKQIADTLAELNEFEDVSITTAQKSLMDAGRSIAESFYRYEQKEGDKVGK